MTRNDDERHGAAAPDWSRAQWLQYADRLLAGARAWASPGHGRITPPGAEGGYGHAVDSLEGFARTFLLAGFRIAGERGQGVDDLIDFYSRGIATGVDPNAPDRWVRLDEHPQAKVEAASLALILDLTRPWVWDRLDHVTQERVVAYLSPGAVIVVDVRFFADGPFAQAAMVVLVVTGVLVAGTGVVALAAIAEDPGIRLRDAARSAAWFALRRWYLTLASLGVVAVFAALFVGMPLLALSALASPALYLVWANSRFTLRPVLDVADVAARTTEGSPR